MQDTIAKLIHYPLSRFDKPVRQAQGPKHFVEGLKAPS
jgi:hypothetical protein